MLLLQGGLSAFIREQLQKMLGNNLALSTFLPQTQSITVPGFGSVGDIHVDTLLLTWASMGTILAFALMVRPMLVADGPGNKLQAICEGFYNFTADISKGQIGEHDWKTFFPLVAAIFIFVLIANLSGILPWPWIAEMLKFHGWPPNPEDHGKLFEMAAPSTDFNVTCGLAAVTLLTYIGAGFGKRGAHYLSAYLNPIEWMDLLIRPTTLALRLMLVITADELLRGVSLMLLPSLLPVAVMGFEIFIALIQAYVFALLTSIYIGLTVSHH